MSSFTVDKKYITKSKGKEVSLLEHLVSSSLLRLTIVQRTLAIDPLSSAHKASFYSAQSEKEQNSIPYPKGFNDFTDFLLISFTFYYSPWIFFEFYVEAVRGVLQTFRLLISYVTNGREVQIYST